MADKQYWLMDGRAHYDIDSATVLECCPSLDRAYDSWHDFGDDTCIVDPDSMEIVDSLMWQETMQKDCEREWYKEADDGTN